MSSNIPARIVRVTSLQNFCLEVPACSDQSTTKPIVRLVNHQREGQHSAVLLLSLQGVNALGEVVWLCEAHTISWLYGKPFGLVAENVYTGMRDLEIVVRAHLESLGYEVRPGDYGLPESIKPLGASFECARWDRVGDHEWQVKATSSTKEVLIN